MINSLLIVSMVMIIMFMITQMKKILMLLLILETATLLFISFLSLTLPMTHNFIIMILTMSVCESSIGLAIIISISRTYSSDNLSLINLMKC